MDSGGRGTQTAIDQSILLYTVSQNLIWGTSNDVKWGESTCTPPLVTLLFPGNYRFEVIVFTVRNAMSYIDVITVCQSVVIGIRA